LVLQSKILVGSSCKLFFKSQISNLKDNFALRREKRRKKKKRKRKNKKPRERGGDHKKKNPSPARTPLSLPPIPTTTTPSLSRTNTKVSLNPFHSFLFFLVRFWKVTIQNAK